MRRLVSRAAEHSQSTLSRQKTGSGAAARLLAHPQQPPLRDAYVALSDFFRSNLQTKAGTVKTPSAGRQGWSSSSLTLAQGIRRYEIRSISSSARLSAQPESKSTVDHDSNGRHDEIRKSAQSGTSQSQKDNTAASGSSPPLPDVLDHVSSFPRSLRQLAMSLPHAALRRPTKDE